MGDEQQGHSTLGHQRIEQVENLLLHLNIERGCRLIADQQVWVARECQCDEHALALPTGKLVRVSRRALHSDLFEQFAGFG